MSAVWHQLLLSTHNAAGHILLKLATRLGIRFLLACCNLTLLSVPVVDQLANKSQAGRKGSLVST